MRIKCYARIRFTVHENVAKIGGSCMNDMSNLHDAYVIMHGYIDANTNSCKNHWWNLLSSPNSGWNDVPNTCP